MLLPESGYIYIVDRGYLDFARLAYLDRWRAVFVVRAKRDLKFWWIYSHPVDRPTGLICDQIIVLPDPRSADHYAGQFRRVRFRDESKGEPWTYLTDDFDLPVAELYRFRWQVKF